MEAHQTKKDLEIVARNVMYHIYAQVKKQFFVDNPNTKEQKSIWVSWKN